MQRDVVRFRKGSILRKEMLESMYNFPRFLCEGYFSSYGDGVLYGLEWGMSDNKHFISPGALKYKGDIYFQKDKLVVEDTINNIDLESGQEYYICFKESTSKYSDDADYDKHELKISFEKKLTEGVFCIRYVKYELNKIKDSDKKIFGLYAMPDSSWGVSPCVIKEKTYDILCKKEHRHPLDYEILKSIYDNRPLSKAFLELYISEYNNSVENGSKIEVDKSEQDVKGLIDAFCKAIEQLLLPVRICQITEKSEDRVSDDNNPRGSLL